MRVGQVSFITFTSKVLSAAVGFVATLYFANVLGAEILGIWFLLLSVKAWLGLLATMGVGNAITKRLSEGDDPGAYKAGGGLIIGALTAVLFLGILVFQAHINQYIGIEAVGFLILVLSVGILGTYTDAMLQGIHLVHVFAVLKPVREILRSILQIAGVFLGFGIGALVYGFVGGGVVAILIGLYVVGGPYRMPSSHHLDRLVGYAKYAWLGRIEGRTFNNADIVILGLFVSPALVGVYGVTWAIAGFLLLFSNSITTALFPEISKLSSANRDGDVPSLVALALGYAGLFTIPGLIGGLILSERILRLYGTEFVQGARVLGLLILAVLFYGYQTQFANALGGIDKPREAFKINSILIGSNVVLNVVLIAFFGMLGAAVASASSTVLAAAGGYLITNRHIPVSIPMRQIGFQLFAAVVMGAVVLGTEFGASMIGLNWPNWLATIVLVSSGAAVYFGVLVGISREFRHTLAQNLPDRITASRVG